MNAEDIGLPPHLQRMVNAGVTGLDIMHGELKNLMLIDEQLLSEYTNQDDEEYDQTVDRLTLEGHLDALTELYKLTYDLSFAIGIRTENRKDGHI